MVGKYRAKSAFYLQKKAYYLAILVHQKIYLYKVKLGIIGSGNIATQFSNKLSRKKISINYICSRNESKGLKLAKQVNASSLSLDELKNADADLWLIAVTDSAIESVANQLPQHHAIFIHTSGTAPLEILPSKDKAVLWPIYSISKNDEVNWNEVPLVVQTSDDTVFEKLQPILEALECKVFQLNQDQRLKAHMMAVMINNFTEHYFHLLNDFKLDNDLAKALFTPITRESFNSILQGEKPDTLTGPARRGDIITIEKHLSLLKENSTLEQIYTLLTLSILNKYHEKEL